MANFFKTPTDAVTIAGSAAAFAIPPILQAAENYPSGFWRLFFLLALIGVLVVLNNAVLALLDAWQQEIVQVMPRKPSGTARKKFSTASGVVHPTGDTGVKKRISTARGK